MFHTSNTVLHSESLPDLTDDKSVKTAMDLMTGEFRIPLITTFDYVIDMIVFKDNKQGGLENGAVYEVNHNESDKPYRTKYASEALKYADRVTRESREFLMVKGTFSELDPSLYEVIEQKNNTTDYLFKSSKFRLKQARIQSEDKNKFIAFVSTGDSSKVHAVDGLRVISENDIIVGRE